MLIRPDDIIHNDSSMKKARILEKQFRGAEFLYKLLYNNEHQILCYAPVITIMKLVNLLELSLI